VYLRWNIPQGEGKIVHSIPGSLWRSIPAVLLFLTLVIPIAPARTIYVSPSSVPDGTGATWATAFKTITAGLAASASGDEIWIRSATYSEAIQLREGVGLYGGFIGNETRQEERDWNTNETVIDANGLNRSVVIGANHAVLDGFTLTGGKSKDGGGVYCIGITLAIANCNISENSGGGVYSREGSLTLTNCGITGNSGTRAGVYSREGSLTLTNCEITCNSGSQWGYAFYSVGSSSSLLNCTIAGNVGISGEKAAFYFHKNSTATITNCILWNTGNEVYMGEASSAVIRYSCIQENWPGEGNNHQYPYFADPANGDYHLQNGSACIDHGLVSSAPSEGLDGNPRPGGDGLVDIGAYESPDEWEPNPEVYGPVRWHVRPDAPEGGDGTSWAAALPSISSVLKMAGVSDEIWVQSGIYYESVTLEHGVALYGGFAGTETTREERDWYNNNTTIDASAPSSSIAVIGADQAILDGFTITGGSGTIGSGVYCGKASLLLSNCNIINNIGGLGCGLSFSQSSATLINCKIADNLGNKESSGCGISCLGASVSLFGCTIANNAAKRVGGGIYCVGSTLLLTSCTLSGNTAEENAGGVFCSESTLVAIDCTFSDNRSKSSGGGLYVETSSSTLTRSILANNQATNRGGGVCCSDSTLDLTDCVISDNSGVSYGGGIDSLFSSPSLLNCIVRGNSAKRVGGGIRCAGGAPTLTDCIIEGNSQTHYDLDNYLGGGGMYCGGSSPILLRCTIRSNSAVSYGGGLFCSDSAYPRLTRCIVMDNTAVDGGGFYCRRQSVPYLTNCSITNNSASRFGGWMYCSDASANAVNCTIAGNPITGNEQGLYCYWASPSLTNCIVWNNGNEISMEGQSTPAVQYSCVRGGWAGVGNVDGRPLFVDPTNGDYHLQNGSACIDHGLVSSAPSEDLDGNPRPGGDGLVDIGAYESPDEWEPDPVASGPTTWYVRADAPEGSDGTSWDSAFSSITAALAVAGTSDEVWVQGGIYAEAIALEPSVALYGGFSGTESNLEERDWQAHKTVIDASGWNRVAVRDADRAVLDGFTVTGGKGTSGGGVYCTASSLLRNCVIKNNAGAGVHCYQSSPTVSNCLIVENTEKGVVCESSSSPRLTNCTIANNASSSNNGGLFCSDSSPVLTNCILWNQGYELESASYGSPVVRYSSIQGGWPGEGNIDGKPLFADPANGDYHLQNGSTGIDQGLLFDAPAEDLEGSPRPGGDGRVDMGAYESPDNWEPGPSTYTPTHWYVRADALPGGDGTSWNTAFKTIAAGLGGAASGEEVWVQAGIYKEIVQFTKGITLYGGFAGNETKCEERNWQANQTIVQEGRVYGASLAALDGFTIRGGRGGSGGGVNCYNCSFTISNCAIQENVAYEYSWEEDTYLNYGGGYGGGVSCKNSSLVMNDCVISGNSTEDVFLYYDGCNGGGIYCENSSLVLNRCVLSENSADDEGGGLYCINSEAFIFDSVVSANSALYGGGIFCYLSSPTLAGCLVHENHGNGLYCRQNSSPVITNCWLQGNENQAIYCYDNSSPILTNCVITENGSGGVSCQKDSSPVLVNCTISGSRHGIGCVQSSPALTNCILWNRGNEIVADASSTPLVRFCCVRGNHPGEGNIDGNPRFVDPANGDYHLREGSSCIDRGFVSVSPALDFDDRPRPGGDGLVDLGAYESPDDWEPGPASHTPARWYVRAGASEGGDGTSWAAAWPSITSALSVSGISDEIWVAGGIYHEAISLWSHVSIYGGFAGNEMTRGERDIPFFETIIDPSGLITSVVRSADDVVLDGFTLTGGLRGLECEDSTFTLSNCTISGNGSRGGLGGGIECSDSVLTLKSCAIRENGSYSRHLNDDPLNPYTYGGWGGGVYCTRSTLIMTQCTISSNYADKNGGGLCCLGSALTMTDCRFQSNSVSGDGGGLYCRSSSPVITNCIFVGNSAGSSGGGMHSSTNKPSMMQNCAIIDNIAGSAGNGIYFYGSSSKIINCIFSNPANEIEKTVVGDITVTYSCVEGGWPGEGNIDSNPMFVHPWDGSWADLRLQPGSPCIDAGTSDVAYNDACLPPGLGGERCDMGAYGGPLNCAGVPEIPTPTPTPIPTLTPKATPRPTWTPTVTPTATATPKMPPSKEHPQLWLLDGRGKVFMQNTGDRIQNTE